MELDFDIRIDINEDGKQILKYFIGDKIVDMNTYYKLKQDRKENKPKVVIQDLIPEEFDEEEMVLLDFINELRNLEDKDAIEFLEDFISQYEEEAYKDGLMEGIERGTKGVLRQFVEQMNQMIYTPMSFEFISNDEEFDEFDEEDLI